MPPSTRWVSCNHSGTLRRKLVSLWSLPYRTAAGEATICHGWHAEDDPSGDPEGGREPFRHLGNQICERKRHPNLGDIFWAAEWDITWTPHFYWNFQYIPVIFNQFCCYLSSCAGVFSYNGKIFKLIGWSASSFLLSPQSPVQPSPSSNFSL